MPRFAMSAMSVRARLALFYALVTSTGLVLFGMLTYGFLHYALIQGKQTHLDGREARLISLLAANDGAGSRVQLYDQLKSYALVTHEGNLFHIRNADGSWMFPADRPGPSLPAGEDCSRPVYDTVTLDGGPVLVRCHSILLRGAPVRLYIGGALDEEMIILRKYRNSLFLLLPAVLFVASFSGYALSRHALGPVDRITKAALEIGVGNLSHRLPVPVARDEIQSLTIAWNQLLARLEAAVLRLSRFSADASHDIRTSITVMLATAQLSLNRPRTDSEYRQDLEKVVMECRTATTLLDALLTLAQSDNFVNEVQFQELNLCDLVVSSCRRVEDLAESSSIDLDWQLPETPVLVHGDELLLQRLLGILLDNAIRHTPPEGEIRVCVSSVATRPVVAVRDTGIGMPEDVKRRVFERFYQADLREGKSRAGNGLGLSIGRWIADAHGANLTVESTLSEGSTFQIQFPQPNVEEQEIGLSAGVHRS